MVDYSKQRLGVILLPGLAWLGACLGVLYLPTPGWQAVAAWILTIALPGYLLGDLLLGHNRAARKRTANLLSLGLGYAICLLLTLLLHYRPGPFSRKLAFVGYNGLIAALLGLRLILQRRDHPADAPSHLKRPAIWWLALLALLVLTLALRLPNLGYSEFQGDEVAVLHKAAAALEGRDDALFLHKKGAAEILLPMAAYSLTGRINELAARLPFVLANVLSIAALFKLGTLWFDRRSGWWAALLLALNGFLVAFARIVQYQSLVLMFSALALLAAAEFAQSLRARYLWLSAVFLALGLWAHSDAIFALLPIAYLTLQALVKHRVPLKRALALAVGPCALGAAILALFYVPFALHPHFAATTEYLLWRGGGQPPYDNLSHFRDICTVYNSVYYAVLLTVGLLCPLVRLRRSRRGRFIVAAIALLLVLAALPLPQISERLHATVLCLLFCGIAGGIWLSRERVGWHAAVLWCMAPLVLYLFGFRDPRTHLYVVVPGVSLLVGAELGRLVLRPKKRALSVLGAVALLGLSTAYLWIMFIDHESEYKRTYPASRLPVFWAPYGDAMPQQGLFGFPYRAGWKTIGYLYATEVLQGDFGTNEEAHIARWYTRGRQACQSQPQYFFLAQDVQDEQPLPMHEVKERYALVGRIHVAGKPKISMYERKPPRLAYRDYVDNEVNSPFDAAFSGPAYYQGLPPSDPPDQVMFPADLPVGDDLVFLGHSLDKAKVRPGEDLQLTLYWRILRPSQDARTVFTHIEDPGVVWAQKDKPLDTGVSSGTRGEGSIQSLQYILTIAMDTPPGPHQLVAGVYVPQTGQRLTVRNRSGQELGELLHLGMISVLD